MSLLKIVGYKHYESGYAVCCLPVEDLNTNRDQRKYWIPFFYLGATSPQQAKTHFHFEYHDHWIEKDIYCVPI
jgi:hypothetical protein